MIDYFVMIQENYIIILLVLLCLNIFIGPFATFFMLILMAIYNLVVLVLYRCTFIDLMAYLVSVSALLAVDIIHDTMIPLILFNVVLIYVMRHDQ